MSNCGPCKSFQSDIFGDIWALELCPNGEKIKYAGDTAISLCL